jgi:DNA-binding transcriptional regulator YhcF (GntR family)
MQLPDFLPCILKKAIDRALILPILTTRNIKMLIVSDISVGQVKGKSDTIHDFPDSANLQLKIPPADSCECRQSGQDRQRSDPGDSDHFVMQYDIGVLPAEHKGRRTSLAARYAVGVIAAYPSKSYLKCLMLDTIARNMRCNRQTAGRAVDEAEQAGYLEVDRNGKCHSYHVCECVKGLAKTWVNPALVRDDGFGVLQAVLLSELKFRQGDNEATWPKIRELAGVLGVSYCSIERAAFWLAALGYIQIRHRLWRRSSKNEYALTCLGKEATGVSEPKRALSKSNILLQTSMEGDYFKANSVRNDRLRAGFGLSFSPEPAPEVYRLLRFIGIADSVARPMAFEQRYPLADVKQAIVNAIIRRDDYCRRMRRLGLPTPRFNLAGYIVATLNGARSECHGVRPSKLAWAGEAKKQGKHGLAAGSGVTDSVTEYRKKEQIHRLLSTPAKHHTPGKSAIPAEKPQFHDKSAEDEFLQAALAAARSRSWQYRKYANLGQKLGFSVDSCY